MIIVAAGVGLSGDHFPELTQLVLALAAVNVLDRVDRMIR